jgi:hypothetical protein
MSHVLATTRTAIFWALWMFTAAVGFQAGSTEGVDAQMWFNPTVTALLIFGFFFLTVVFSVKQNRMRKQEEDENLLMS